jgi:hypothetical protein
LKRLVCATLLALMAASGLHAWNYAGHMIIAYIAYQRLTPAVRARVDGVIRKHPDYSRWIKDVPAERRGVEAFMNASVWADTIRWDERFWEPGSSKMPNPTPLLPGFPDMEQHGKWHYRDLPVSVPGAPAPPPDPSNGLTAMRKFVDRLGKPYELVWFLHIAGDAHQPLHAASRFLKAGDTGDRGGNEYVLEHPARNLHAYWDNIVTRDREFAAVQKIAEELMRKEPSAAAVAVLDFEAWFTESYTYAVQVAYRIEGPKVTPEYEEHAVRVARERVALAGYRLGAVLNERLQ